MKEICQKKNTELKNREFFGPKMFKVYFHIKLTLDYFFEILMLLVISLFML